MLISVITVCFNSSCYIESAIKSVLSQDYDEVEYIIIDGGSTDGTLDIIKQYRTHITHLVSESDSGIYDAMNKGLKIATGDVISILNSDDFYMDSNVLSRVSDLFSHNEKIDLILGGVDFIHPKDLNSPVRHFPSKNFKPWKMRFGFMPPHPGAFIKRETYLEVGYYRTNYLIASDFDWFVRSLFVHECNFLVVDDVYVRMRVGGVSTSGFKASYISSKEMSLSLSTQGIFSSFVLVSVRIIPKFFDLVWRRFK